MENYSRTLKTVEISLPINYHKIIKHAADYAKFEKENFDARNYYVLILVCTGVIDDYEKTLNALKRLRDLPISVLIVTVRNM